MKKNIGDKLRSEPVNIRSSQKINDTKRSRRKLGLPPRSRSGKVLERTLGAPLMAGFYGTDDRSNECPIGYIYDPSTGSCILDWDQNVISQPWDWDPAAGSNWGGWTGGPPNIIDESIDSGIDPNFNPFAGGPDTQPGFGSGNYNPTGESFGFGNLGADIGWAGGGTGSIEFGQDALIDPFEDGPEDQPGFGSGQYNPDTESYGLGNLGLEWGDYDLGLEPIDVTWHEYSPEGDLLTPDDYFEENSDAELSDYLDFLNMIGIGIGSDCPPGMTGQWPSCSASENAGGASIGNAVGWGVHCFDQTALNYLMEGDCTYEQDAGDPDDPIQGCPGPICPDGSCAYQLSNDQGPAGQWYCGDGPGTGGVDPGGYLPGGN
tara:strand:- start:247 stop:1371 length:1125 start_codon:yes stop_codon:yes gene_type:complete